jgi:hypothetical protein
LRIRERRVDSLNETSDIRRRKDRREERVTEKKED